MIICVLLSNVILESIKNFNNIIAYYYEHDHNCLIAIRQVWLSTSDAKPYKKELILQVFLEFDSEFSNRRGTTTVVVEHTPKGAYGRADIIYNVDIDDPTFNINEAIKVIHDTLLAHGLKEDD